MSPEQARGEELTTASDMYSFGLLLQAIFTGTDPHPLGLTGREVILRAARGETIPVTGVSGDIAAVINRLKQFAPADRPTAIETVARLRFLADKTRRIIRRSAIAAAIFVVVFGAWRYTVDLARERTIAVNARAEAEKRRAQAEDLIEFMLGDLRAKLEPVGRLDILDDVGERALQYVGSLKPETMSAGELARNAKALNQLGEVRVGQGKTPEALALFGRSLNLAGAAVKREPKNPDALMVFGQTHFWIGNGLRLQGKADESLQHMREYMKAGDALAVIDPHKKEYVLEKAYGHSNVAFILEQKGEFPEALDHYKTSLTLREELASREPADAQAKAEVAKAYNKLAVLFYKVGDLHAALDYSRREVDLYRRLMAFQPEEMQWKSRLGNSMAYLAHALTAAGDSSAALALWQEAVANNRELAERDPANVDWQRNLAIVEHRLAWEKAAEGDRAAALKLYRPALEQMDAAVRLAPTRTSFVVDAMNMRSEYGRLLSEGGDPRGIATLRDAIARLDQLTADRYMHFQLARSLVYLGEALMKKSDAAGADAAFERAERELAPLVSGSANPDELALWTRVLVHRKRAADAHNVLARLQQSGYATTQLEQLCAQNGC
jgi:serine/threonine-protein kinase